MKPRFILKSSILVCLGLLPTAYATDYSSTASGNWDATIWSPAGVPQTGATDNVSIGAGHNVLWNSIGVGLPGTGDLGTAGGHIITINGGTLAQVPVGNWMRIGQGDSGGLNINAGAFYFTSGTGTTGNSPTLQVGLAGGTGNVNVGDGTGGFGSAILDLRHLPDGFTENSVGADLNIGSNGAGGGGGVGRVVVDADGSLITDVRPVDGALDPKVRIGQASTLLGSSSVIVKAGGNFTANGTVEIAAQPPDGSARSGGSLTLTGTDSFMGQTAGMLQVGLNGDGTMLVEKGAQYLKSDMPGDRQDLFVGTNTGSTGSLTIASGSTVHFGQGNDVGDARYGYNGIGVLNINDGGTYFREAGNWDWIGQGATGNGTVNVNKGGLFHTTGGANVVIGNDASSTGLFFVNGGSVLLENLSAGGVKVGVDGSGTYRQSGDANTSSIVSSFLVGINNGTGLVEMNAGTMTTHNQFYLGGDGNTPVGNGTSTYNQTAGDLEVGGSLVVGLGTGHTGSFNVTGGTVNHLLSDITIGENGTGSMVLGSGTVLTDYSPTGTLLVGRNGGSVGSLIVNGTLTRVTAPNSLRVGNGSQGGNDDTDAQGTLGGTGTINLVSGTGVVIGAKGVLSGGTTTAVGTLTINGNLTFSTGGTLTANFDATGNVDRLNVNGSVDITGAKLTGTWAGGTAPTGASSRYWLIVNDGTDAIAGTFANTVATSSNSAQAPGASAFITLGGQEFGVYYGADQATNALSGGNDVLLVALTGSTQPTGDQIQKTFLGTNAAGGPNLPVATVQGNNLVFTYNRVEAATASYTGTVEYSTTLGATSWTTATAGMTVVTGSGTTRTVTVTIPAGSTIPREFARLKITSN